MKRIPLLALTVGLLTALASQAAPPTPGTIADNVSFSELSVFDSRSSRYRSVETRTLESYPDSVVALIFATPW